MAAVGLIVLVVLAFVVLILGAASIRVVQQFQKGIVFRLGRIQRNIREPGLTMIVPFIDRLQKVNMQVVTLSVPAQDCMTRDNVSVRVDAVVYFRVIDPIKAIVNVQNYMYAVSQIAQTSLRSVIGKNDLDKLLSERDKLNDELAQIIDEPTEGPWGISVERVEIKEAMLPEGMKRSMSRQAEAERDRRGRIISADGEFQASKRLAAAAHVMSGDPASLQLRLLQTVVEVSAEKNSTLIMPMPVELLRFFEKATGGSDQEQPGEQDEEAKQAIRDILQNNTGVERATDVPDPEVSEAPSPEEAGDVAEAPTGDTADEAGEQAGGPAALGRAGQRSPVPGLGGQQPAGQPQQEPRK